MTDDGRTHAWLAEIPAEQWEVYRRAIQAVRAAGVEFAVGGAFAVATYTGCWRNTKDLDLYVLPEQREQTIAAVMATGMVDYYDILPYVREWIFRLHQDDIIVDVIWAMANSFAAVDPPWILSGPTIGVRGEVLRVVPPEEMIWAKLYVLQKERCDWPDIFNIIQGVGPEMDWDRLIERMAQDLPLLSAALGVFAWLHPQRARELPAQLWPRLHLPGPQMVDEPEATLRRRADRLDTRPWFTPLME